MAEPYTIRILVPDGNPEGVKIVDHLNWTGVGVALARKEWSRWKSRPEFRRAGVYVLIGAAEENDDELPTVYVGQGDEIGTRIESHVAGKDFWDWCYAFVSKDSNALNRAHITWLEHSLIQYAIKAGRCHLDNGTEPKEPTLAESEKVDTQGFLREMLRILPLLGVHIFQKPVAVVNTGKPPDPQTISGGDDSDLRDTVVVPAHEEGFKRVFLGENSWYAIRISGGMLERIKYIASYRVAPISAVTHYAKVLRIEPYGDGGKYKVVFSGPAIALDVPLKYAGGQGGLQGPRYTSFSKLLSAKKFGDLLQNS